ncbi:MAG: DUF4124 domain-containing protein [Candidatus Thiodiazotropha sp. (ex Myrtea sp. 'scaly one' KF741663)]|nr:DUF4124 domain-containing protein [Candidatus Thiodiazotropha sp. (ex Myrtea sp. 'scaly one' KF741663)]
MKFATLICLLILFPGQLFAGAYKWVNEDGVVTFSQTPPSDMQAERVKVRSNNASTGESSSIKLDKMRQKAADNAEDRELKKQEKAEAKEQLARKKKNCQAARSNLQKLQGLGNRLYMKDGQYQRLSEESRQSLMQQEREHIKANCGS